MSHIICNRTIVCKVATVLAMLLLISGCSGLSRNPVTANFGARAGAVDHSFAQHSSDQIGSWRRHHPLWTPLTLGRQKQRRRNCFASIGERREGAGKGNWRNGDAVPVAGCGAIQLIKPLWQNWPRAPRQFDR